MRPNLARRTIRCLSGSRLPRSRRRIRLVSHLSYTEGGYQTVSYYSRPRILRCGRRDRAGLHRSPDRRSCLWLERLVHRRCPGGICLTVSGNLAPKPASLDHTLAAAVPISALTAWQALIDRAQISEGQRVLIHGAAGGVGSFAVQVARHKKAHVIATASGRMPTLSQRSVPTKSLIIGRRCSRRSSETWMWCLTLSEEARETVPGGLSEEAADW